LFPELFFIEKVNLVRVEDSNVEVVSDRAVEVNIAKQGGQPVSLRVDLEHDFATFAQLHPGDTPQTLAGDLFGLYPYMWSVNTTTQYFDLMKVLSQKLGDRSLAGYFLAQFNRSCRERDRLNKRECNQHSYSELDG